MSAALKASRLAAVKVVHAKVNAGMLGDGKTDLGDRAAVAELIRSLTGLSRAPRWDQAVESYAQLVEDTDNPLPWAYAQGSVWFSYGVEGLT